MPNTVFARQGETLTVKPEGRLDTATSPQLEKEMQPHLEGIRDVVMDLENVEYISSGGLRVMLAVEQELEQRGGGVKVIHANSYIIEVFEMVGFTDVVEVIRD